MEMSDGIDPVSILLKGKDTKNLLKMQENCRSYCVVFHFSGYQINLTCAAISMRGLLTFSGILCNFASYSGGCFRGRGGAGLFFYSALRIILYTCRL